MKNYPEYVDERAKGYFRIGYTGRNDYRYHWDSQCGAKETLMIVDAGTPICAYCGNRGLPLQPNIQYGDYDTVGHTCVCKDAMDSLEVEMKIQNVLDDAYEESQRIRRECMPKINPDVARKVLNNKTERLINGLDKRHADPVRTLEDAGVSLRGTWKQI
ncbi:hypothetical protein [Salmonella phage SSBI34]|nr:hypothetical protein [Salmonella phage SSBI34]